MIPQLFFIPGMAYICVYMFYVRRAVKGVRSIYSEYEKNGRVVKGLGWDRSITAVKLMLDSTVPRENYPANLKRDIGLARFFFYTSFPVCFVCWFLMVIFSY